MRHSKYPTDLSDVEWACLKRHLPSPKQRGRGRPKVHSSREILNAIFYVLKSGCPWRLLPRDFPPWKTVYHWFRKWRIDGSAEVVHRKPKPTSEKIARIWAEEWAKEGREIDWQKLLPRRGFELLPRRRVVERTFSWLSQNRRMSKDYERLCATSEGFVYAVMTRLMVRRLASG
jgi:transposase